MAPDSYLAHFNAGNTLRDLGRLDEAIASFKWALVLQPDHADAYNNLGNVLRERQQLDQAAASLRHALQVSPGYAAAHYNLGNALRDLGQPAQAAASYRQALDLGLNVVQVHNNLGIALRDGGHADQAAASYRRALALAPDYAEAHNNLAVALRDLRQLGASAASSCRALAINPQYADAHYNLGISLENLGRLAEAVASYRLALALKPNFPEAHNNLGNALNDQGQHDAALASYRRVMEIVPDFAIAHSNLLFALNYLPGHAATTLLAEAKRFGQRATQRARPFTAWGNEPDPQRHLRVGLVSGDLREHPVGYFIKNVLAALASTVPRQAEYVAYDNRNPAKGGPISLTERIKAHCQGWHSVHGLSDEALAQQIRTDGIDILIDLSGHTADNRLPLFAWKAAPVQVSWLGYFATTGVTTIDYLIADPWTLPPSEDIHFTETIWRLPETRLCFAAPNVTVDVSPLPALENGYITFGCFNTLTKMNDAVVALWARILHAVPNSRLFLKSKQFDDAASLQSVKERFGAHGIDRARLLLEGPVPRADYLKAYHRVDIALDPFPFPGGATTAEALWMGVPVLTLAGEHFLARQGVGLLANAGLPAWIAVDAEDYAAKAVAHAADVECLASLRSGLRQQVEASPLFDAQRFAGHFATALRDMWKNWCKRQ